MQVWSAMQVWRTGGAYEGVTFDPGPQTLGHTWALGLFRGENSHLEVSVHSALTKAVCPAAHPVMGCSRLTYTLVLKVAPARRSSTASSISLSDWSNSCARGVTPVPPAAMGALGQCSRSVMYDTCVALSVLGG
eukprot:1178776-Prorocentrum_minimum.AAC.6